MGNLSGKNIVISGANAGIGKTVALESAKEGANVILAVRNAEKAEYLKNSGLIILTNKHV